ncbi:hypothetical protein [Paenibacillus sp. NPDC058071]|uniref:hypothetical protein n=1 Tax=Paenibacillus sp. NPDC058071 TaxID=3346326 RepID=UPI0036D804F0
MNYRNNDGSGGYPHQQHYPPHSPHGGHHRQAQGAKSQGIPSFSSKSVGIKNSDPILPVSAEIIEEAALPTVVVPATAAELVETTTPAKGGLPFSLDKLGDIKGFVDRLGGLDGILNTVSKVQKVVSSVSQMAPLVKVLMGSFKKSSDDDDEDEIDVVPKKRRRRKPGGSGTGPKGRRRKPKRRR